MENGLVDTHVPKLSDQSEPGRVNPGRGETFLRIVAHMSDVDE